MRFGSTFSRGVTLACALLLASAPVAAAASGTGENTPLHLPSSAKTAVHHASSGGTGILRTVIALVVVIALIYAVARVLKAVKGGGEGKASGEGLTHLATLPLAPGKSVALVRSGSDVVLVGIAESGVTPIKTYTEAEAVASGMITPYEDATGTATSPSAGLLENLRRMTVRS